MLSVSSRPRLVRWMAAAAAATCLSLLSASAEAGPAKNEGKDEAPVTEEQLEYSKQLFGEGEKAMRKKDFVTAQAKYTEAYRYAPHLHLFTFNIASAAEAAGDCRSAHYYFGQFLALVPEHPERERVEGVVQGLQKTCPIEVEDGEIVTKSRDERDQEKEDRAKARAMNEALANLKAGADLYTKAGKVFKDQRAFKWAGWRKKRHAKKMAKVLANHDVKVESPEESSPPSLPADLKAACKTAKVHEKRTIESLEKVLQLWETQESYRAVSRFLKGAQNRDYPKFDDCAR